MITVTLSANPDFPIRLAFRYDRALVEDIKSLSPAARRYDPESKSWLIKRSLFDKIANAYGHLFAPLSYDVLCAAYPARKGKR